MDEIDIVMETEAKRTLRIDLKCGNLSSPCSMFSSIHLSCILSTIDVTGAVLPLSDQTAVQTTVLTEQPAS